MSVEVRYYCPRCGRIATLDCDPYLADKSVTPYPLEGWEYATPDDAFEDADGVRLRCGADGETDAVERAGADGGGCGEEFFLNFVRFEDGEAVEPTPEGEHVRIAPGPEASGPETPETPGGE